MNNFGRRVCLGFSPTMLYPKSFEDPLEHFAAIEICCRYPHYETFETFLPEDEAMRKACIQTMRAYGIKLNYNPPGILQQEGPVYPCSDDPAVREAALAFAKMHADFAAEAQSPVFAMTACADKGEERRPELLKRFEEYFMQIADHCRQYHMEVLLEPIERHRFKKMLLGPTAECAAFIEKAQKNGADNVHLMLDIAHLPLMEETLEEALEFSLPVGLSHIHMGEAVCEPGNRFYGHTHPPLGVHGGVFHYDVLVEQFVTLFQYGLIPKTEGSKRVGISLEVRPYPGCTEQTSIQMMYEMMKSACDEAAGRLGVY